jgi:hypothetical protein
MTAPYRTPSPTLASATITLSRGEQTRERLRRPLTAEERRWEAEVRENVTRSERRWDRARGVLSFLIAVAFIVGVAAVVYVIQAPARAVEALACAVARALRGDRWGRGHRNWRDSW